ncbi:MAG: glycosyltransferase [Bacteroidia bacterium]|nr:glycosyltransferase [Bacteroidia bacterium]
MERKRIIISVISDLVTDQRVHRTALTYTKQGWKVTLVGRKLKSSMPLNGRRYRAFRFQLPFEKGPLFYAAFNIRLFFYLMFRKFDLLVANDLDTLLANYLASTLKRKPLLYDSHEFFTGVPELENNSFARKVWISLERLIFPRLRYIVTVNDSIAALYNKMYHKEVKVIRNIPEIPLLSNPLQIEELRNSIPIENGNKLLIMQGAGINVDRGAEEAVQAMQYLDSVTLLIIGSGDVIGKLKAMVKEHHLDAKVKFLDKMPFDQLMNYTRIADAGLTLDKDTNINYRLSLPNKLFDYIHAGIPVLASFVPEVKKIVEQYNIGVVIENHDPRHIADKITFMFADNDRYATWKKNLITAARQLSWSVEEKKLLDITYEIFR